MDRPAKILKTLKQTKRILIPLHINVDGDSAGSALALYHLLKSWGKEPEVVTADPPPENLFFLPEANKIREVDPTNLDLTQYDLLVILDNTTLSRFSRQKGFKAPPQLTIVNIDHHPTNEIFADINYVTTQVSSTAEILYDLIKGWKSKINKAIALCLLTGIFTDTEGFRNKLTTPESMEKAAALIRLGADHPKLINNILRNWPPAAIALWEKVLENLKIRKYLAYSTLTKREIEESGIKRQELSIARSFALDNFIRSLKGADISAIFYEEERGLIRGSLRSKTRFNVAKIAEKMGGGGHKTAAGFITKGKLEEIVERTITLIKGDLK